MATTNLKVTLEFGLGPNGWSETYYHAGDSATGFMTQAGALVVERAKFLTNSANIHHVRISAAQPGAASRRYNVWNGQGALPQINDVPNVTVTVGCRTGAERFRKVQFHGYPDIRINMGAGGNPAVPLPSDIEAFMQYLIAQAFQIRTRAQRFNADGLRKVVDVAVADNGVITFTTDSTGYVVGDKKLISSMAGFKTSQFNGVWTIGSLLAVNAGFTSTTRRYVDKNFLYTKSSGVVRSAMVDGFSYNAITSYETAAVFATRRVGRPSNSPRGRR